MSLLWSEDLKQLIASLYFVGAGLVLSNLQQLVVTAFLYNLHLIEILLLLCQSNCDLLLLLQTQMTGCINNVRHPAVTNLYYKNGIGEVECDGDIRSITAQCLAAVASLRPHASILVEACSLMRSMVAVYSLLQASGSCMRGLIGLL